MIDKTSPSVPTRWPARPMDLRSASHLSVVEQPAASATAVEEFLDTLN